MKINAVQSTKNTHVDRKKLIKSNKHTKVDKGSFKAITNIAQTLSSTSQNDFMRTNYKRESMLSLDKDFLDDPLKVSQYCKKIFEYVAKTEVSL